MSATLTIDNSKLDNKYRVGIFSSNQKRDGLVRFSNGDPNPNKPDKDADVRGMALKIYNVPYETYLHQVNLDESNDQDFVFMDANAFFIDNSKSYVNFMEATQGRFGVLTYLATNWTSAKRILSALKKPANPLDLDYESATPYKLGNTNMKMKFETCKKTKDIIPENPSDDFLGENLK